MRSINDSITKNLSKREKEVCNLLIIGNTTNEIAKVLNIKSNTVSTIKKTIFYKKNVCNIIQLYDIYKQA